MKLRRRRGPAFTLVEVVLAIGVVSFSLLAVFGLFSASLQSNTEVINQTEALSTLKALPAYLQAATDPTAASLTPGFATVYNWLLSTTNPVPVATASQTPAPPKLYAYIVPAVYISGTPGATPYPSTFSAGKAVIHSNTDPEITGTGSPNLAELPSRRQDRLFGIYLAVSPNFPIGSVAHPTALPANPSPSPSSSSNYNEAALAVQVKVYAVSQINQTPATGANPILTYDILVPH